MRTVKIGLVVVTSIFFELIISPIRLFGIEYSAFFGFFIYFFFVLFLNRWLKFTFTSGIIAIAAVVGIIVSQLPLAISSFASSLSILPDIFFRISGTLTAYFFLKSSLVGKIIMLFVSITMTLWMAVYG